ncbi:MAG TPA: hypothetical protein VG267_10630 [Terracidiphilus sp.]|nr:hypothetical protein [Terracidiphilus sp.]
MASPAVATPPRTSRTFAGMLEEYAAPAKFPPARDLDGLGIDGLEDDVATLTYEHALKAHARYRPEPDPVPLRKVSSPLPEQIPLIPREPAQAAAQLHAQAASAPRKSASVTVRLTAEEDKQLRARAAEAGLTISAYLRSCAFEVESLRAQVKEAVARMSEAEQQPTARPPSWLSRLFRRSPRRA